MILKDIVFAATISKQGSMKVIVIPAKMHDLVKKIDGQILVKLSSLPS